MLLICVMQPLLRPGVFSQNGTSFMHKGLCLLLLAAGLAASAGAASAADEKPIRLELNKLEARDGACRTHFVIHNPGERTFSSFKVDLVFFDKQEIVAQRISLDLAPLRPRKTNVLLFDIPDIDCKALSKILVNDVTKCRDGTGDRSDCVALVEPRSRASVRLIK